MEYALSRFETEKATEKHGRPDITGYDQSGEKQVIIEGKFWAKLTENQPVNYVKELPAGGKMLFLAPEQRRISLENQLKKRLSAADAGVHDGGSEYDRITVSSWLNFLSLIERENISNHDHHLESDLLQMKELCRKMDTEGMRPLSELDLDSMHGRISYQFEDIIYDCELKLKDWKHANFDGLSRARGKYERGFYFEAYEKFACMLFFSSYRWYAENVQTPFWLRVQESTWEPSPAINRSLKECCANNVSINEDIIGIELRAGMDKDEIIAHIVDETKKVLKYVHEKCT
ncbi:MAG: hypothetical protein ACR2PY_00040 [Salinispira sp.]